MESGLGFGEGYCRSCGRRITSKERFCQHCGRSNAVLDEAKGHLEGAGMAGTGGLLLIISAVLSFLSVVPIKSYLDALDYDSSFYSDVVFRGIFNSVMVALVLLGIIAILGGLAAYGRGNYGLAMAGGLASVFNIGGAIGLAGLMMIAASKNDFKSTKGEAVIGPQMPREPGQPRRDNTGETPTDSLQKSLFVGR